MKKIKKFQKKDNTENKKVKNARITIYDGISFKSKLEVYCYKKLKENGIPFEYEPKVYTLFVGNKPNLVSFYDPDKKVS